MKALLISSPCEEKFTDLLREAGFAEILRTENAKDAFATGNDCALILLNASHAGPSTLALLGELARRTRAAILLLVPEAEAGELVSEAAKSGVFVLGKPLSRAQFLASAYNALALHCRLSQSREETQRLKDELYEAKTISRAKIALVKYLNMSESQAHRYIEKQAMDRRVHKLDVALSIIANYDV